MRARLVIVLSGALLVLCAGTARTQMQMPLGQSNQTGSSQQAPLSVGKPATTPEDPMAADQAARQAKLVATDRRKRILDDTAKLVALTNELKAEVEKSTKDEMSLAVIRKAMEIEKLSHDLKDRMKGN